MLIQAWRQEPPLRESGLSKRGGRNLLLGSLAYPSVAAEIMCRICRAGGRRHLTVSRRTSRVVRCTPLASGACKTHFPCVHASVTRLTPLAPGACKTHSDCAHASITRLTPTAPRVDNLTTYLESLPVYQAYFCRPVSRTPAACR